MIIVLVQPVREDNCQFVLHNGAEAVAVDPADAAAVDLALREAGARLAAILVTHHHADHVAGVPELVRRHACPVIGPREPALGCVDTVVGEGAVVPLLGLSIHVLHTPGHSASHIAFHAPGAGLLFAGDVIFPMGCGRVAPGQTAETHYRSIQRLAALPPETRLYCGHEYAEENARFSLSVAPGDAAVRARAAAIAKLRRAAQSSVPTTIGEELRSNLFVRAPDAASFAALRLRKDRFR